MEEETGEARATPICRDCKFIGEPSLMSGWALAECRHPELTVGGGTDKVSGYVEPPTFALARTQRNFMNCGEEGKMFSPRGEPFKFKNPLKAAWWFIYATLSREPR